MYNDIKKEQEDNNIRNINNKNKEKYEICKNKTNNYISCCKKYFPRHDEYIKCINSCQK